MLVLHQKQNFLLCFLFQFSALLVGFEVELATLRRQPADCAWVYRFGGSLPARHTQTQRNLNLNATAIENEIYSRITREFAL